MSSVYRAHTDGKYKRPTKGFRIQLKTIIGQTNQTERDARSKVEQSGKWKVHNRKLLKLERKSDWYNSS